MPLDGVGITERAEQDGSGGLLAGDWRIELGSRVPALSGRLEAFAARHRQGTRGFAVACRADMPPRAADIANLLGPPIENLLTPRATVAARLPGRGNEAREAMLVVHALPPGPPIIAPGGRIRPWAETELVHDLLRPGVRMLAALEAKGVTHRGIRPDNLFRPANGGSVTFGEAWCLPPALAQPFWCEAPQVAQCLPEGRGPGTLADDVFALGVCLIVAAAGRVPWAGMDPAAFHRARLERGSFNVLAADLRLPGALPDLLRAMLADDPDLRPEIEALQGWPGAMQGRKGSARVARKAGRPLVLAGQQALDMRSAAWLLATNWADGIRALRSGSLDGFLRRGLGDSQLAEKLSDLVAIAATDPPDTADDVMLCRAIAMLDPLAPLCWRGVAMMPEGLGPLLARDMARAAGAASGEGDASARSGATQTDLVALVAAEAPARWAMSRGENATAGTLSRTGAQWRVLLRTQGLTGGAERLLYHLNPGLPCLSPLVKGAWASTSASLLAALEAAAADRPGRVPPPDRHVAAFLAARNEAGIERLLQPLSGNDPAEILAARAAVLARLQARFGRAPAPNLAAWIASEAGPLVATWKSRSRRAELAEQLESIAATGELGILHAALDDATARRNDTDAAEAAQAEMAAIDAELASEGQVVAVLRAAARHSGQQAAAAISMTVMFVVLLALAAG